jgi:hypothetical protein
MATITDRAAIDVLIANNGIDPGDEASYAIVGPVVRIVEYTSAEGQTHWGIVFRSEVRQGLWDRYMNPSRYINDPHEIWKRTRQTGKPQ